MKKSNRLFKNVRVHCGLNCPEIFRGQVRNYSQVNFVLFPTPIVYAVKQSSSIYGSSNTENLEIGVAFLMFKLTFSKKED